MAIDTPARIAIIGAGPIGLEAALYARFLGYDVDIYDRGQVCQSLHQRRHIRFFSPFGQVASPLAIAAIQTQDPAWKPHAADDILTGQQWLDDYYLPLSQTDLLADCSQFNTEVLSVGRQELLQYDLPGEDLRADSDFRLLLRPSPETGEAAHPGLSGEHFATADAVLDCSGTYASHNWLGRGGIPAAGELALRNQIEYQIPDIQGAARDHYAHCHTLVIGAGEAAATCVEALVLLARELPYTMVTWITRSMEAPRDTQPLRTPSADASPEQRRLAHSANALANAGATDHLHHWSGTWVEKLQWQSAPHRYIVDTGGKHAGQFEFDRVIACVGHRPDRSFTGELQFMEHGGTRASQSAILQNVDGSTLILPSQEIEQCRNPEPDFYVLGAKTVGRMPGYTMAVGLDQIKKVFMIIGDRPTLDLYQNGSLKLDE
ncbi:MAG: hypothetical protein SGJ20_15755 [Planctomycetota bacterium]|nr:hypothetical protein [Planctomycetota bacterium]